MKNVSISNTNGQTARLFTSRPNRPHRPSTEPSVIIINLLQTIIYGVWMKPQIATHSNKLVDVMKSQVLWLASFTNVHGSHTCGTESEGTETPP